MLSPVVILPVEQQAPIAAIAVPGLRQNVERPGNQHRRFVVFVRIEPQQAGIGELVAARHLRLVGGFNHQSSVDEGAQIISRMAGIDPIRDVAFVREVLEVGNPDAEGYRRGESRLFVGVLATFIIVIGKNHDMPIYEILLATVRQAITATAESESRQADLGDRVHVLLTLRPMDRLSRIGIEWIATGEVRHGNKALGLAVLPTGGAIGIGHAIDVHRVAVAAHDLDPDRYATDAVDVPPLLVVPDGRAVIACNDKSRLAVPVRWSAGRKRCRRSSNIDWRWRRFRRRRRSRC